MKEKHEKTVYKFSMAIAIVSMIVIAVLLIAQAYVRWYINQSFTFLGGYELEVLTISVFALLIGLAHAYKPRN
jgi:uncharacterized membrane protein YkgB